ncbi:MAG: S1 RNA-binding domain-containing protein [Phycisphaerae bacterium]
MTQQPEENQTPTDQTSESSDDALNREIEEALGNQSLEDLIEQSDKPGEAAAGKTGLPSGVHQGRVIGVHGDDIFVYFGGKTQGVLPASQFDDEPVPSEGDTVDVTVEGYDQQDGLFLLSRKGAVLEATWDSLQAGAIVEGRVTGMNKGGLELEINGIRAFMPVSQVEMHHVEDLSGYLNEKLKCEVQEVDRSDKNVVVSRRRLLEAEAAEAKKETLKTLEVGQVVTGVVKTIMPYGAFVDIGGVDGLLHISDMSHGHVDKPTDVVKQGDKIEVKVLKFSEDTGKISLGLKQTMKDPWQDAAEKWPPESTVSGRITRLADFGAFVEVEPGVEGLIPISEMTYGRRIHHPKEVLSEGDVVEVKVLSVDPKRNRMSLSLKAMQDDPWMGASARWPEQARVQGKVRRTTDFGAFVEVAPGVEGLVHISQLSEHHVHNVEEVCRQGDTVEAVVLSVDEEARRMSLSIKALTAPQSVETQSLNLPEPKSRKRKKPLKGGLEGGGLSFDDLLES